MGRLFVFEGPDGVGKTTLSREAVVVLSRTGRTAEYVSFPGTEPETLGRLVYDFHHSRDAESINPLAIQAMHVSAHVDAIERKIRPLLTAGIDVVLDRYWWSTWVYGVCDGIDQRVLRALIDFEELVWRHVAPTAVILLQRRTPLERPDAYLPRWRKLQREYAKLARTQIHQRVERIDNNGDLMTSIQCVVSLLAPSRGGKHGGFVKEEASDLATGAEESNPQKTGPLRQPATVTAIDRRTPTILLHLEPAKPTRILDTYWRFAAERQRVFFCRAEGQTPPWTKDEIVREYKFTNAYRASDRVSQYLIRNVIYRDDLPSTPDEVVFRILLFKFFNKIETWEMLEQSVGPIEHATYSFNAYDDVLGKAMASGTRIYSAAYIMPTGGRTNTEVRKHRLHLRLLEQMMADEVPAKIADSTSMHAAFDILLSYPTIGPFLAYQFVTDINYSEVTEFSEQDFVVPGPGALDGIRKCFASLGGLGGAEIIRVVTDIQEREFERLDLKFQTLWGRRLQLIDCQNLFCEVDKYSRVAHPDVIGLTGRTRIKQRFEENRERISYWYPPKWKLNDAISNWMREIKERGTKGTQGGDNGAK